MTPILRAAEVRNVPRLEPVNLEVRPAELIGLIGPNGSGKTSLLRALADVEGEADRLEIEGEDVRQVPRARRPRLLSFLPASRDVVWPISVHDLVALGLPAPNPARVEKILAMLDLGEFAQRPISSLSTGERSRALLGRALAPSPKLLLLDEPLSNMDPCWVLRVIAVLREVVAKERCSAIVALHDLHQLDRFDRILLMDRGRLISDEPPSAMLESSLLSDTFELERRLGRWELRKPQADPQSLR